MFQKLLLICCCVLLLNCGRTTDPVPPATQTSWLPDPPREFRAAWVATVANIDWPSKPGLPVEQQESEAIAILDRLVELNMNAVILQVRPHCDALYASKLEPWSYYLTGEQGKDPDYDPLEFWVEAAHQRGLQLHAWFNPYRASHPSNRGELSADSVVKARPDWVVKLGNKGYWWMVPTLDATRNHTKKVVMDVVRRYEIDGVHFDDYFYPYRSYNDNQDFPDSEEFTAYQKSGGKLSLGDWRREAVNDLIRELYQQIKKEKPRVEFGISPFGIWRPGYPEGIRGMDPYSELHADARLWLNEGWVDYFTPQLYWPISKDGQSFPVLLGWWAEENKQGRHLWPGSSVVDVNTAEGGKEAVNQVWVTRGMIPSDPGLCLYSMKWILQKEYAPAKALVEGPWSEPALIPESSWLEAIPPLPPKVEVITGAKGSTATLSPANPETFQYVISERFGNSWRHTTILPASVESIELSEKANAIGVRAVNRARRFSEPIIVKVE